MTEDRRWLKPYFDHERLEVYRVAREFNCLVRDLLLEVPAGQADSRNNLRRAAMSVTRNIAEGCGKWKIRDKINFLHIARASATECAACLDELVDFEMMLPDRIREPRSVLARVVAMLTNMIRSLESRTARDSR